METFNDYYDLANEYADEKFDVVSPLDRLRFYGDDLGLRVDPGNSPVPIENRRAFRALTARVLGTTKPVDFLWDDVRTFSGLLGHTLNPFLQHDKYTRHSRGPKRVFMRGCRDGWRYFASEQYVPYDTHNFLADVAEVLNNLGGPTTQILPGSWLNRDGMHLKILFPDIDSGDSGFGQGVIIKTGEVGQSSHYVLPAAQRNACWNSFYAMYTKEEQDELGVQFKIPHRWKTPAELRYIIAKSFSVALDEAEKLVQAYAEASYRELFDPSNKLARALKAKLGREVGERATYVGIEGMEGQHTVAGLANAITFAAQHAGDVSKEQRAELEALGGGLLMASRRHENDDDLMRDFFHMAGVPLVSDEEDA